MTNNTTKTLIKKIKLSRRNMCWVVTCLPCDNSDKKSSDQCIGCGILDWYSAFETEKECNQAFKKQYPDKFDINGNYVEL
jgi:hypothetical protein